MTSGAPLNMPSLPKSRPKKTPLKRGSKDPPPCTPKEIRCEPFHSPDCQLCGPAVVSKEEMVKRYLGPIQNVLDGDELDLVPISAWGFCFMSDVYDDINKFTWEGLVTVGENLNTLIQNSEEGPNQSWVIQLTAFHALK